MAETAPRASATISPYVVRRAEELICGRHNAEKVLLTVGEVRQLLRLVARGESAGSIAPALGEALQAAWAQTDTQALQLEMAAARLERERAARRDAERRLREAEAKFARLAERLVAGRKALGRARSGRESTDG